MVDLALEEVADGENLVVSLLVLEVAAGMEVVVLTVRAQMVLEVAAHLTLIQLRCHIMDRL